MSDYPDKITVNAIIRDFKADHPDFETDRFTTIDGLPDPEDKDHSRHQPEKGIVKAILGSDGKPVYNGDLEKGTQTTSGKRSDATLPFDEWYRDHANVNTRIEYPLTFQLVDGNKGFYECTDNKNNNDFFPIDDKDKYPNSLGLLPQEMFIDPNAADLKLTETGNKVFDKNKEFLDYYFRRKYEDPRKYYQSLNHNYHFTLEAVTEFTYRGTEEFTFDGDDDLWVFIDGKLVIDLGGLHTEVKKTLDLRLNQAGNRAADKSTTLVLRLKEQEPLGLGIEQAEEDLELVLQKGQKYEIRLFYAERHTPESHFYIFTSLQFEQSPSLPPSPVELQVRIDAIKDAIEPYAILPTFTVPGVPGQFQIRLNKPAPVGGVKVRYELVNDNSLRMATENVDFTLNPAVHEVIIPQGQESALIDVIPLQDNIRDDKEAVVAKLIEYPEGGYALGDKVQDIVFIHDQWQRRDNIVCVAPVRTVIRAEQEIVVVRRVRKVEEVEASPACPINTTEINQVQQEE